VLNGTGTPGGVLVALAGVVESRKSGLRVGGLPVEDFDYPCLYEFFEELLGVVIYGESALGKLNEEVPNGGSVDPTLGVNVLEDLLLGARVESSMKVHLGWFNFQASTPRH
jgi:hypothetical protein